MTINITPSMIKSFTIDGMCYQRFPCSHDCVITLEDGRTKKENLSGPEICALIKVLAKEKIIYPAAASHFLRYDVPAGTQLWLLLGLPAPEKVLTEIFNSTIVFQTID